MRSVSENPLAIYHSTDPTEWRRMWFGARTVCSKLPEALVSALPDSSFSGRGNRVKKLKASLGLPSLTFFTLICGT